MKSPILHQALSCKILLIIYVILLPIVCQASEYDYGLNFIAQTADRDHRTSLELNPTQDMTLPNQGYNLKFDIRFKDELYSYGYVVRIVINNNSCFDVISHINESKVSIVMTDDKGNVRNETIVDSIRFVANKWLNAEFSFDCDSTKVSINGNTTALAHNYKNIHKANIYFGVCNHPNYYATDVAPMMIKNLQISSHKKKILYEWPMAQHNGTEVYDLKESHKATVKNGVWNIDKHTNWQKAVSFKVNEVNPQIAYNEIEGRYYVAASDSLYVYDSKTDKLSCVKTFGYPYQGASSQMIYDAKSDKLISYTTENNILRYYDFNSNSWSGEFIHSATTRQHHNKVIIPKTNELILFGGYGNYHYNSHLSSINIEQPKSWQTNAYDSLIYPRYLSAMGLLNDNELLILGGYGSKSGVQEESPQNFYDLYKINLSTKTSKKLWRINDVKEHFTLGNSMIVDTLNNCIYALTYNNNKYNTFICLSRFDINTNQPQIEVVSNTIPYSFLDIRSYCDMFLHKPSSTIYAVTAQGRSSDISEINIYKLAFPPVVLSRFDHTEKAGFYIWKGVVGVISILLLLLGYRFYRKRRASAPLLVTEGIEVNTSIDKTKENSSILLLGGFRVFDKEGNDLTGDYTPTIRNLFVYLLLNSVNEGRGVSSQQLDETFWYDMDKSKATNNRNVNMRKLRLNIEKIGGVKLIKNGIYWTIEIDESVQCDYEVVVTNLIKLKQSSVEINKETVTRVIHFASAGMLLPNIEAEWVERFKSYYSSLIIETMATLANDSTLKRDKGILLGVADVMLISDNIDEDAIAIKCRTLYQMGKKGLSKQSYDKYCEDYNSMLNATPELTYEKIISGC